MRDYGLTPEKFPEIRLSTDVAGRLGKAAEELGLKEGIPVVVGAGDIPSAAIGSGAIGDGDLHIYVGTSDWVAGHLSGRKTDISHYIGSLLSAIPGKYLLIAEQEIAAGALDWFLRLIGMEGRYAEVSELVSKSETNLIFFPWLYGERAPIDDPYVRGGLLNFSLESDRAEVLRAVMEGVALNIKWAYALTEKLAKVQQAVNLVGGGARFDAWCQMIADAIDRPVRRMRDPQETGIRGSAAIAAVSIGEAERFEEAVAKFEVEKVFKPDKESASRFNAKFKEFKGAYKKLRKIYRRLNA
jgi:xylulokinase